MKVKANMTDLPAHQMQWMEKQKEAARKKSQAQRQVMREEEEQITREKLQIERQMAARVGRKHLGY